MGEARNRGSKEERVAYASEKADLMSGASYKLLMVEIKRRFRAAGKLLSKSDSATGDWRFDLECAYMQVRLIVELIVFSALTAERDHYARQSAVKNKKRDYRKEWRAKSILELLNELNPNFLPQAAGDPEKRGEGIYHVPYGDIGPKVHEDLVSVYDNASDFAHVTNPFDPDIQEKATNRPDARERLEQDLTFLRALIWKHMKISVLPHQKGTPERRVAWIVDLLDPMTDDVHITTSLQDI